MSEKENTRSDCAVRIAVRERPFSKEELKKDVPKGIEKYSEGNIIIVEDRPFGFDHVFEQSSTQEEVFEAIGRPLVEKMLSGFNCSLLAYGQSGNGKTFTMGLDGAASETGRSEADAGIIIRTLRSIFNAVSGTDPTISDLKLEVSFIEIYNERVYDLLSPKYTEAENIRGPFKKLFTKRAMKTEEDAQEILAEAYQKRHVRPTKINLTSSRSHAVFTIYATIKNSDYCSIQSELNLVDLAGAEGVRKTGHHGQALAEGVNINQGLLSVGRILQAIAKGDKVIPYRESVLTRVLQESLNRNCFLTLLACVSPSKFDSKETLSTLRFAENVGTLKNNPKINVIMNEITMARRKTPTKQMFTPRPNSTFKSAKRITLGTQNNTTLKKKCLNFPDKNTSTAKKDQRRPSYHPHASTTTTDLFQQPGPRPTMDTDFSFAGNISTSTFIGGFGNGMDRPPAIQAVIDTSQMNFSPVIRKCMATFESKLDERIGVAMNEIAGKLMDRNSSVRASKRISTMYNDNGGTADETKRARRSTRNGDQTVENFFAIPVEQRRETDELFPPASGDTFELDGKENSTLMLGNDDATITVAGGVPLPGRRRSSRVHNQSVNLNESQLVKRQWAKAKQQRGGKSEEEEMKPKKKQKNPQFLRNKYLASYFRLSTQMEMVGEEEETEVEEGTRRGKKTVNAKVAQNTHSKEVLNILNIGNLKELQILPQIGLKTAYQIMTFRATKGKFKSFKDLKKLNWTEKKVERFMQDNYLS